MPLSEELKESFKEMSRWERGASFLPTETIAIYECEKCKERWQEVDDGAGSMRCINADCHGTLIARIVKWLKGEEIYNYGRIIKKIERKKYQ